MTSQDTAQRPSERSKRLTLATRETHDTLGDKVMGHDPFGNLANYTHFATAQYLFLTELAALHTDPRLTRHIPDLPERCRAELAKADLLDLGVELPTPVPGAVHNPSMAQALGWVFVSEGSKLGAGVLIKQARALGLSEEHGARHMGEPAVGRGRNWKSFIEMLDAIELTPEEDAELEQAANDAFNRFTFLLEQTYVKQPELA
ncbi:biliverdin-producing heme oxygenase [Pseudomonas lundensis]|uniref:Heme utilization protein n=1 Tax=Pseudomonas lundensis TaxID=86185 RepID=A0AAX2H2Z4_9PSED|nr:biliverdin-producing heme oxygenase [Pseudomonas lundensis]SOB50163.1 Heme utilization protein [Pseudomonas lundensis]